MRPVSMSRAMWTISSRLGCRMIFHMPSSRLSFLAARSKRAAIDSQGLISCSSEIVVDMEGSGEMTRNRRLYRRYGGRRKASHLLLVIGYWLFAIALADPASFQ